MSLKKMECEKCGKKSNMQVECLCGNDLMDQHLKLEEEKYFVIKGMIKYGGSFVKSLGQALSHADIKNTKKIKKSFPEYWEEYLKIGEEE